MGLRGLVVSARSASFSDAYTHRHRKLAQCLKERGIECDEFYVGDRMPFRQTTLGPVCMPWWIRTLREYDFIHAAGEEAAHTLFFCKPLLKQPIICDIDGDAVAASALAREINSEGKDKSPRLRTRVITWMSVNAADQILTVCTPHVQDLIRSGIPEDRVSLIRNGVDLDLFTPSPQAEQYEYTFGYAGEFQVWQDVEKLIAAMEMVTDPDVTFLMIGFRESDRHMKQRFRETFGRRAKLVDRTDQKTMIQLLHSAAITIISRNDHPASLYAFPTRFAEFAALRKPVLVNDVDETADFTRRYSCGFVSDPSAEGMAKTMKEAAGVSVDKLHEMGTSARRMAEENFSWDIIGDTYADLVRTVVERY